MSYGRALRREAARKCFGPCPLRERLIFRLGVFEGVRPGEILGLQIALSRPSGEWRRNLQPRFEKIGLGWASFQVLRRTYATLSREAGVDAKTRPDQMGHDVDVTENEYAVTNLAAKLEAGRKLEAAVNE